MEHIDSAPIHSLIDQQLIKLGKDFATVRQILDNRTISKLLNIKANTPQNSLISTIKPHLGPALRLYQAGRKNYILRNQPDIDLVLKTILAQSNPKTLKQWSQYLPLTKTSLLEIINNLLSTGQISVNFNTALTARIIPSPIPPSIPSLIPPTLATPAEDAETFRAAYDATRNGRDTVRIHKMREHLGWDTLRFDTTLAKLRADYIIDLHLGDASRLSSDEVKNSYIDPHGMLYIGLSWRE